jgi:hypothetical protein
MDFLENENRNSILSHSIMGLRGIGLIGNYCAVGCDSDKSECLHPLPKNGIIMEPTIMGAETFLYALGYQNISGADLLNGRIKDIPEPIFSTIPTAKRVQ